MSSEQITVTVVGPSTNATITSGTQINVTLGDVGPINWSEVAGKPTTFPPQAHSHAISDVTGLTAALAQKVELDPYGKVLASQLPSYVDDVLEFANLAALPATGETGKIYVTTGNGKIYRWSGTTYIEISAAPGSTDFVPEGTTNLYHTTARAAAAAPVQSVAGKTGAVTLAKADVGLGNVDNTADASKPVSTAQAAADAAVASAAAADATSKANAAQAAAVQRANHTGTQAIATVDGLQAALDGKAGTTDSRLTDARTPTAHKASHATGGTDALTPADIGAVATNDSRLTDQRVPTDGSVTDAKITAAGLSTSSLNWAAIQPWAANTAYSKGDLVSFEGIAYRRSAAGTSGATFNIANWQQITPTAFVASQIASGTIATARLGSGTASSSTFLRGDQSYAPTSEVFDFTRTTAHSSATGGSGSWTWTVPSTAKTLRIIAISGGGGGGSGRRGANGTVRFGGGAGSGGLFADTIVSVAELPTLTLRITVGAGGAGGAAVTANDTNGNNGTSGGLTKVVPDNAALSPALAFAPNQGAGSGGTVSAGSAGFAISAYQEPGAFGTSSSTTGTPGGGTGASGTASSRSPTAGGGGGGIDAADIARSGGGAVRSNYIATDTINISQGNGGTAPGGNGTAGGSNLGLTTAGGMGGGGGAAGNATTAAGNGGNGAYPGGGGGGGGASFNGYSSGAGGNGADGFVRIVVFY